MFGIDESQRMANHLSLIFSLLLIYADFGLPVDLESEEVKFVSGL